MSQHFGALFKSLSKVKFGKGLFWSQSRKDFSELSNYRLREGLDR